MIIVWLYCFAFILLLAFGQSTLFKLTSYLERRYVRIVNHLNNKPLTYHCEFADDDFGNVCFTFPALHASILHDVCVYIYVCMSTPRCYSTTYRGDAHAHYTCCGNVSYLGCVIEMWVNFMKITKGKWSHHQSLGFF